MKKLPKNGEQKIYADNVGRVLEVISKTDSVAGCDLYLSINKNNDINNVINETININTDDIVKQIKGPIYDNDTMGSLFSRQNELTGKLCVETVTKLERGETLPRTQQPQTENFKKAPKIHPDTDDVKIDWNKSIKEIDRFIRALNPFFGATSFINGIAIIFWDTEMVENPAAGSLPPGTVTEITNEEIYISAKDGFIKTKILIFDHNKEKTR